MKLAPKARAAVVATRLFRRALAAGLAVTFVPAAGYRVVAALGQAAPQQSAPAGLSPQVITQVNALLAEKAALTPAQRKIDSRLLHAKRRVTGETRVTTIDVELSRADTGKVQLEL